MNKHRIAGGQAVQRLCALKAALRSLHEGPDAIPRKAVYDTMGWHNATYSRYLNDAELDFPDMPGIMAITALTRNPAVLAAALEETLGDDYQVTRVGHSAELAGAGAFQLLSDALEVDHALEEDLLRGLADGRISSEEAKDLIPKAEARVENAKQTEMALRQVAASPNPFRRAR